MRTYTAHLHGWKPPVLVREAFAWGGLWFGPLWLLRHAAWIAAAASILLLAVICLLAPHPLRPVLAFGVFLLLGVIGNDLRRWSLARGHYELSHVVAARNDDDAFYRLISHRPDLNEALA